MIPSDLAARLRFLHEASLFEGSPPVAGLHRSREIQAQLQDLAPGQRFFATLQRTLPDGTFRALVAGRQITLALNASAQPGDTLELVATRVTPGIVLSRLASPETAAPAASARPNLSPTGQLISFLLTGQPAAKPTALANNQPFFSTPPPSAANANAQTTPAVAAQGAPNIAQTTPAAAQGVPNTVQTLPGAAASAQLAASAQTVASTQLAPMLRQALAQSGLFYESHLTQWLAGKIDLAALAREPQSQGMQPPAGQAPSSATHAAAASSPAAPASSTPAGTGNAAPASGNNAALQAIARNEEPIARVAGATGQPAENPLRGGPIAERLLPIVHQQLETLASQQYVWHGMAWPGQAFEWIIEDPRGEGRADGEENDREWRTTLRLTLPRLGGIQASVRLTASGVALRLDVDDETAARALETHRDELEEALAAAGVPLTGMAVERRDER
ncbi:MAG: flagellar hook-length control protein FliK [Azoarcus sp.]|jgi:hypothetical protein|nr:flagellar hook-length control protein FliK [Azoarcus sp.]